MNFYALRFSHRLNVVNGVRKRYNRSQLCCINLNGSLINSVCISENFAEFVCTTILFQIFKRCIIRGNDSSFCPCLNSHVAKRKPA